MSPAKMALLVAFACATIAVPFMVWQETWFGRSLSDAQIHEYLAANERPRRIQHALTQIAERILAGDRGAPRWYPQVVAMARHPEPKIRMTAAWCMGQDNRSEAFHHALTALLSDPDLMVRRNAALSLVRFGDASGREELVAVLRPYPIRSTHAGRLASLAAEGEDVRAGTLLGRLELDGGERVDIRSPFPGRILKVGAQPGNALRPGAEILALEASADQVWEALRGLYLVGRPDDLPDVDRYAGRPDRLGRQAAFTAGAIRTHAERNATR